MAHTSPKSILITGASSGLGAALACEYAAPGVTLFLGGRNMPRLQEIEKQCQERGARVELRLVDVTDAQGMIGWINAADALCPLDLVIANAGISAGTGGGGESVTQVKKIFATNIDGVLHTVHPAADKMRVRKRGQIAIIASLAGFRGMPSSPAYSASKAAVRVYGEGLRGVLAKEGIGLSVVTPGYIVTPMTAVNDFPMPWILSAPKAARKIRRGLACNCSRIAFPWPLYAVVWLLAALPAGLVDRIVARLPAKPNAEAQNKM